MFNRMLALVSASLLTVATYAYAADLADNHPDTYVVKKGDTLWSISARFLKQPWQWPEIWQANPQLKNPHDIYPGDVLSLRYINGQAKLQVDRSVDSSEPITTIPLAQIEDFLKKTRVVYKPKELPYVVGVEEDRERVTSGQLAYARGVPNAQAGDMFAIMRPIVRYARQRRHSGEFELRSDDDDFRADKYMGENWDNFWRNVDFGSGRSDYLGTEMQMVSLAQVTRPEGNGIQTATLLLVGSGGEVQPGDRVLPVEAQPFDLQFFPHPPKRQAVVSEYTKFRVIGIPDGEDAAATHEVIALSGGTVDAIDNGTVFSVWRIGDNAPDTIRTENAIDADVNRVKLADEYEGHVMVFRAFDKMSYGLIMDATKEIHVGDILKHPDATR